jgi:hypothetical protein
MEKRRKRKRRRTRRREQIMKRHLRTSRILERRPTSLRVEEPRLRVTKETMYSIKHHPHTDILILVQVHSQTEL